MRLLGITFRCLALACLTAGCSSTAGEKDLIGTYIYTDGYAKEALVLREDRTFEQIIQFKDGRKLNNSGTWRIPSNSSRELWLENALIIHDLWGKPRKSVERGTQGVIVSRWRGKVTLTFNSELELAYKKTE